MKKIIIIFFVLMLLSCSALATDWYVDNSASGTNAGTSWTNAWESFSDISWGSISAGDTVYISGGSTSQTYHELLSIGASGSSGSPITIKIGQEATHNGKVIIDGDDTRKCIEIGTAQYITIDGQVGSGSTQSIECIEGYPFGIHSSNSTGCNNIHLTYLEIDNCNLDTSSFYYVIYLWASTSVQPVFEIDHCLIHDIELFGIMTGRTQPHAKADAYDYILIHDNDIYNFEDDVFQDNAGGASYYNNTVHGRMVHDGDGGSPHFDGFQIYGSYYKIYDNEFYDVQVDSIGNGWIYIEFDGGDNMDVNSNAPGDVRIYNNLFYNTYSPSYHSIDCIQIATSDPDWTSLSNILIANNVFAMDAQIGLRISGDAPLDKEDVTNIQIVNNIFADASDSSPAMLVYLPDDTGTPPDFGSVGDSVSCIIDYNVYYGSGSSDVYWGTTDSHSADSYAAFVANSGCQDHGLTSDPSLDSNYSPDDSSDPPVDAGYDLSAYFTTDKDGTTRSGTWEIGAYNYDGTPTYSSGTVNGSAVSLTFSEDLDGTAFANIGNTDIILTGTTTGAVYVTGLSENNGVVSGTAASVFVYGETVTLSTDVGFDGNELCDADTNCITSLSGETVVNNTQAPPESPGSSQWGSGTIPAWNNYGTIPTWVTD